MTIQANPSEMGFFEYSNFDYRNWDRPVHSVIKDERLRSEIYQNGHVIIENFITEELVRELRNHYDSNHSIEAKNGGFFVSIYSKNLAYRKATHDFLLSKLQSRFDEIFSSHKHTCLNFAAKYPGPEGELFVHQDMGQVDEFKHSQVGIWLPLEDVSLGNGTLCVIPNSHFSIPPHRSLYHELPFSRIYDHVMEYVQPLNLKAGDLLLFDTRLLHNSFANTSMDPRIVIASSVVPQPAEFYMTYRDATFTDERYELLSLDDDFFLKFKDFKSEKVAKPGKSTGEFVSIPEVFITKDEFEMFCKHNGLEKTNLASHRIGQTTNPIQEPVVKVSAPPKLSLLQRIKKTLSN